MPFGEEQLPNRPKHQERQAEERESNIFYLAYAFHVDRSEYQKGAERRDGGKNRRERGVGGGQREREKEHKGVCNGSPINDSIWTSVTLIDMHLPLIGKWDFCSLQPCLASKWQSKTMSFRSHKSGWGESPTDSLHAELFKKGNRLTSQHHH